MVLSLFFRAFGGQFYGLLLVVVLKSGISFCNNWY
nr:MAG TPA: hypothetical protein [Caudoviricetes sp.]